MVLPILPPFPSRPDDPSERVYIDELCAKSRPECSHILFGIVAPCTHEIHDLGRERFAHVNLWSSVKKPRYSVFARWETIECYGFCFPHTNRQMYFEQKLGRRSPHITGRSVSTVHRRLEPLTSSPRLDFSTLLLISSNEVCGTHEITPLLTQNLLEISQAGIAQDPRQKCIFPENCKAPKTKIKKIGPIDNR